MKKRIGIIIAATIIFLMISVSVTYAYLMSASRPVKNTFTLGEVNIELYETSGDKYFITPGASIHKDPKVTVKAKSDKCWLFVEITKANGFDHYMSFEMADGWQLLEGHQNVYYMQLEKTDVDTQYSIIKGDILSVYDTVTEEQLDSLLTVPSLSFKAFAIQHETIDTPVSAWEKLKQ